MYFFLPKSTEAPIIGAFFQGFLPGDFPNQPGNPVSLILSHLRDMILTTMIFLKWLLSG